MKEQFPRHENEEKTAMSYAENTNRKRDEKERNWNRKRKTRIRKEDRRTLETGGSEGRMWVRDNIDGLREKYEKAGGGR